MSRLFRTYKRADIYFTHGEGVRLFDDNNKSYLDFCAGVGVNAFGYGDKELVKALKKASENIWHPSNLYKIKEQEELAKRLCENSFAQSVFFTNSGTEAVECALKTARHYFFAKGEEARTKIITFKGAFHGRTFGAISAAGNKAYLEGFGEPLSGFEQVETNIDAVKNAIDVDTGAILIEPVQGEGGVNAMSDDFLRSLRQICDEHNLLLILDEVQCGFSRTGKLFAYQWSNIEPDIMAVAKGIGAGFPLGACLAKEHVAASMVPGTHGSTYGGNPLACTIGNMVMEKMLREDFLPHVREVSTYLSHSLHQLQQKFPSIIKEIRGRGLMMGLKITPPIAEIIAKLRDNYLLTVASGDNVLRLLPPLVIQKDDIDEAIKIIEKTFAQYEKENGNYHE